MHSSPASSRHRDDQLKEALVQTYPSGLTSCTQTLHLGCQSHQGTRLWHHFLAEKQLAEEAKLINFGSPAIMGLPPAQRGECSSQMTVLAQHLHYPPAWSRHHRPSLPWIPTESHNEQVNCNGVFGLFGDEPSQRWLLCEHADKDKRFGSPAPYLPKMPTGSSSPDGQFHFQLGARW